MKKHYAIYTIIFAVVFGGLYYWIDQRCDSVLLGIAVVAAVTAILVELAKLCGVTDETPDAGRRV